MIEIMYDTFDEWFDIFAEELFHFGYVGPLMQETFESDYNEGLCPYKMALSFYEEITKT
jgi:hypothetical protein